MGNVAFATLRTDAGLLAGDDTLDAQVAKKVKRWLRSEAAAWPWPELKQRFSGVALATAARRLLIGGGASGGNTSAVDESGNTVTIGELLRVENPIWVYTSTYNSQVEATITPLGPTTVNFDESVQNPTTNIGTPTNFKVRKPFVVTSGALGQWLLIPNPVPDKAYLLAFDAYVMPPDPGDSDLVWYPNDETTVEAIKAFIIDFKDGSDSPAFTAAMSNLSSKVVQDRQRFGVVPGTNQLSVLDPGVFL